MADLPEEIELDRLVLRAWSVRFAEPMHQAITASLPELRAFMPWAAPAPSLEGLSEVLAAGAAAFAAGTEWPYAIFERSTGELVGATGVHARIGPRGLEIGYWVRTDRTRRGYATESATGLIETIFAVRDDVDRVEIHMDAGNAASAAVPPKVGLRLVRREPSGICTPGEIGETYIWAITRDEWRGARRTSA